MRLRRRPVLANYYVTYRCNATCSFCDIWEKPSPYVTLEQAERNLSDLKRLGVKVIDFTGGEPLLHREIDQLLALAKSKGFITTITTNGLLYPKWAERLRGLVDMLHFSLDSPIGTEHDESRGVKCFDAVMRSIEIAKELGERPDVLFTVFSHNTHQIEAMYEQITKPNGLVLILNPAFAYNEVGEELDEKALAALEAWGKKPGVYLNRAFIALRREGGNHADDPVCKAASTTLVISPEDKLVLPCYHLGLEELPIEGILYELYRSQKVQDQIAMEGRHSACEGCTINCYMQPSFAVNMNRYFWMALPSTLKYNRMKGTWKEMLPSRQKQVNKQGTKPLIKAT